MSDNSHIGAARPAPSQADAARRLAGLQAVLFDLDGTLIDTVELILVSFRHATETVLGEALPDELLMENVGVPLAKQMREFSPEHADELLRVYREFNHARHDELAKEYPGTLDVLGELRSLGVRMGIVTSKGDVAAGMGIRRFGLADFMDVVVTADDVPVHKPDPFPLRFAASQLGVDLEYCVYVGDSPHDMRAAVTGGAIAVAALWGAFPPHSVLAPGPAYALDDIRGLPPLIAGAASREGA